MFCEWSGYIMQTDSRRGFCKNDIVYLVDNPEKIDIKATKYKILYIEYDINAPDQKFEGLKLIVKKYSIFNRFLKPIKIPYHWVGKTKPEALKQYFQYSKQFKQHKQLFKGIKD